MKDQETTPPRIESPKRINKQCIDIETDNIITNINLKDS